MCKYKCMYVYNVCIHIHTHTHAALVQQRTMTLYRHHVLSLSRVVMCFVHVWWVYVCNDGSQWVTIHRAVASCIFMRILPCYSVLQDFVRSPSIPSYAWAALRSEMCLYVCVSVGGHDMYVCACVSECVRVWVSVCVCVYLFGDDMYCVCVCIWAWLPYVEEGFVKRRGLGPVSPPLYFSRVSCSES